MGVLTGVFAVVAYTCFGIARAGHFHQRIIQFISILSVLFYNLGWYWSFGSEGPSLALIIGVYIFFMLIWHEKYMKFLLLLMAVNLGILFYLEFSFPQFLNHSSSEETRVVNAYMGTGLTLLVIFALVHYIKKNYITQYQRAKQADELKAAFLANLSHEVRTPLNVIAGFTTMIAEEEYSREDLDEIHKLIDLNGRTLLHLLEDIVDYSKLNVDELIIRRTDVDLENTFKEIEDYVSHIILDEKSGAVELKYELYLKSNIQSIDQNRIKQILRLLISNALRYTEDGEVLYGVREEEHQLVFWVKDTGAGIKQEDQATIFEPFVKGQNRSNVLERGIGLGLPLSKKLVEKMGGIIWFSSEYGAGSDFYFTIPKKRVLRLDFNGKIVCD
ncbi:sensor histidine kinase [Mangrovibacterium diazotrophicum]|uniref:histidine kinase n=1 Tax=Mangrovibacterium diazotrophicum TaxID=1261403 RepID=A0A419VV14_9BACT|nr:HAMP domain-containing sensor histidine kinase [Mangrovibacterium diazotrophicum]RKD85978.1 signal transduction histidine kinase [Mangrovibacterium diazotrophicum]